MCPGVSSATFSPWWRGWKTAQPSNASSKASFQTPILSFAARNAKIAKRNAPESSRKEEGTNREWTRMHANVSRPKGATQYSPGQRPGNRPQKSRALKGRHNLENGTRLITCLVGPAVFRAQILRHCRSLGEPASGRKKKATICDYAGLTGLHHFASVICRISVPRYLNRDVVSDLLRALNFSGDISRPVLLIERRDKAAQLNRAIESFHVYPVELIFDVLSQRGVDAGGSVLIVSFLPCALLVATLDGGRGGRRGWGRAASHAQEQRRCAEGED